MIDKNSSVHLMVIVYTEFLDRINLLLLVCMS